MTVVLNLNGTARLAAYDADLAGVPASSGVSNMGSSWSRGLQLGNDCSLPQRCLQVAQGALSVDARSNPAPDEVILARQFVLELPITFR